MPVHVQSTPRDRGTQERCVSLFIDYQPGPLGAFPNPLRLFWEPDPLSTRLFWEPEPGKVFWESARAIAFLPAEASKETLLGVSNLAKKFQSLPAFFVLPLAMLSSCSSSASWDSILVRCLTILRECSSTGKPGGRAGSAGVPSLVCPTSIDKLRLPASPGQASTSPHTPAAGVVCGASSLCAGVGAGPSSPGSVAADDLCDAVRLKIACGPPWSSPSRPPDPGIGSVKARVRASGSPLSAWKQRHSSSAICFETSPSKLSAT